MLSLQTLLAMANEPSKIKPGKAQVGAPHKAQKEQSVLNMRKDTFVKIVKTNSQSQKIPKKIPMRLNNRFHPNSKRQKNPRKLHF